jgi:HAD superfamily hydrolase (TIGR01509 family)
VSQWFGQTFKAMISKLGEKHNFEITAEDRKLWAQWEEEAIIAAVAKDGQPCKGAIAVIEKVLADKVYNLAIVSSSSLKRMLGCLDGVNMRQYFKDEYIFSANTSLPVPTPKPASDVYEFALEKLGITAEEAVAVEDSRGGLLAANGAGIDTIGYLGCINMPAQQAQLAADFEAEGAAGVMWRWEQFWEILAKVEAGE